MSGVSSVAQITSGITALSGLLLVTPQNTGYQPQNNIATDSPIPAPISTTQGSLPQSPSFLFNYEGENSISLTSDITDHFIEDNSSVQDQITLKPEMITVSGFVGELNDIAPAALAVLKTIASKLTVINAYTPVLSATAINAYNEAFFLYQNASSAANTVVSAVNSLTGGNSKTSNQTKQQVAFTTFYGYWLARYLFTVQTPWAVFPNMAIQSLRAMQDADTRMITNFEITFKKMRFASTSATPVSATVGDFGDTRGAAQAAGVTNLGTSTPPLAPLSLSSAIAGVA